MGQYMGLGWASSERRAFSAAATRVRSSTLTSSSAASIAVTRPRSSARALASASARSRSFFSSSDLTASSRSSICIR